VVCIPFSPLQATPQVADGDGTFVEVSVHLRDTAEGAARMALRLGFSSPQRRAIGLPTGFTAPRRRAITPRTMRRFGRGKPMFRLIQISDTHLSPEKAHFAGNWAPLTAWIAARSPDLVIHTGDVSVDGADSAEDLRHCAGLLRGLGIPFRAVPGNHDVGDCNHRHQPVNRERLARWHRHFGSDRWAEDVAGWRLISLDAMLIGSSLSAEREQFGWLESVMERAAGRHLAWFLHRPLFLENPDEGNTGYWAVRPGPRRALLELVRRHGVALVASGHLHKARQHLLDGTRFVWCPSSAFLCGPDVQPTMPGDKRLGAVRCDFSGDELRAGIAEVPGLAEQWIDDLIDEIYPAHRDT
jgi:3',5'-cyclic AMP phosphodiesterase CpdA